MISDQLRDCRAEHTLYLRPKSLVLGVGCKKNIAPEHLEQCFLRFLEEHRLSRVSGGEDCYSCAETKRAGDSGTV